MRLGVVRDLVAHARLETEDPAIGELGLQLAGKTQQDVTLPAPMIRAVARRILDEAHPDSPELSRAPSCDTGLSGVFGGSDTLPIGDAEGDVVETHLRSHNFPLALAAAVRNASW